MNKLSMIVFASFALAACAGTPHPAISAEDPNIMILGEDSDPDSVPRKNRIYKRVFNAISNALIEKGFKVSDETAVTSVDDKFEQGRTRRTDAEIIDIARSVKYPPINVAVIFTVYGDHKKLSYTAKVKVRVEGRLLNVKTGQRLGNFEVPSLETINVSLKCDRDCLLEEIGDHAKELSEDLGAVLAIQLSHIVDKDSFRTSDLPTAYALKFSGFKPEEIDRIEEHFTRFRGYKHHQVIKSSLRTMEYWYETSSENARLTRNFRKMLDLLDIRGGVSFSGNKYRVEKYSLMSK